MYLIDIVETPSQAAITIQLLWLAQTRTLMKDVNYMNMFRMLSSFKVHPMQIYIT